MIALTLVIETNRVMSFLHSSMTKKKLRGQPQHVREASRRSEIDFFLFRIFFQRIQSELAHFFFADFVVRSSLLYTTKSAKKKFILQLHLIHFRKVTDATVV